MARHAQARQVEISGDARETAYFATVRDDGCGFEAAAETAPGGHFGLVGLHERARLVGGNLEIESAPQQGTVLRFRFPLPLGEGKSVSAERSSVR